MADDNLVVPASYSRSYDVRWADLDLNGRVRHSAYSDYAVDLRFHFLADHVFPATRFQELKFGPIILAEESRFLREVVNGETITVTRQLAGLSADGSLWKMHHDIFKQNGKKAVRLRVEGAWLDLNTRKPTAPPPELLALVSQFPRTDDFEELSLSRRK